MVDGHFHWFPPDFQGSSLPFWVVIEIGLKMQELNKPFDDDYAEYVKNNPNRDPIDYTDLPF